MSFSFCLATDCEKYSISLKPSFNIKICNHFYCTPDADYSDVGIVFENYKYLGFFFFFFFPLQNTRCDCNGQPCGKTTGLYDDLLLFFDLFHFFYFIFCGPISLFSNFSISLFIFMLFLKLLSCVVEKLLCIYIYIMYNIF